MAEKPEDLNLPNAVIARLIKESIPDGVNVSKEARSAVSKAASVFVLYVTSCANNIAQKGKRKTLTATDIFKALDEIEFEEFIPPLKEGLDSFKKEQKEKKDAAAEVKRKKSAETIEGGPDAKKLKQDEENGNEQKNGDSQEEMDKDETGNEESNKEVASKGESNADNEDA